MQSLIFLEDKNKEMYPLTLNKPKALLKILDKSILERNLDQLENIVDEAIIFVENITQKVKMEIGHHYKNIKIKYGLDEVIESGLHESSTIRDFLSRDGCLMLDCDYIYFGDSFDLDTGSCYRLSIDSPWTFLDANRYFLGLIETEILGEVEDNVSIHGKVYIGPGTKIRSGTVIDGPVYISENCIIGPLAYIGPNTVIHRDCQIRAEVSDSVIMSGTKAKHHSYIGNSVIGEGCNIGAGTITSDFRNDGKEHITLLEGKKVDTKRRKLGAFLGDNVKTGCNTVIYPGRKIWAGKTTLPGEIVSKDICD